jgi:ribonuclease III
LKAADENTMITWKEYQEEKCVPVENDILHFEFTDRGILIRALTRSAFFSQGEYLPEHNLNGHQIGLDTIGDTVLDFAIFDNFIDTFLPIQVKMKTKSRQTIHGYRKWYGMNDIVQEFSKKCIHLQKYVIWGQDEEDKTKWESTEILADCFEALVGAVYTDQGIQGVRTMMKNIHYFERIDKLRSLRGQKKSDFHLPEN